MLPSAWQVSRCGHHNRCFGEPDFKPDLRSACAVARAAVNADHMGLALRHACEKFWSEDHEILHAIPVAYYVDDSAVISDPRGMYGQELRVTLHLISAPVGPIRNLLACVEQCHLVCDKLVVTPYASALSTLMQDEIDLGTLHLDMGGGTTSFTIFYEGAPVHTGVVPVGGHHIPPILRVD